LTFVSALAAQDPPLPPPDLSDGEKLFGLSLLWQEANYNFAFFDQVPDLDWDSAYRAFIPQVLATESTYDYYQELKRFVALLEDGHTSVWLSAPAGQFESYPWVLTRNVQGKVLVANVGRTLQDEIPVHSVIETIDGEPAAERALRERGPFTFSSTEHDRHDKILAAALKIVGPARTSGWSPLDRRGRASSSAGWMTTSRTSRSTPSTTPVWSTISRRRFRNCTERRLWSWTYGRTEVATATTATASPPI
jgi:hypothetical protein